MPKVLTSQIIGNQGEALVAYHLSKFCLVRPVAAGTDIGVDLYCESITENQPNNHFWIQVKSSRKRRKTIQLSADKISYWERQPIPVFIFLVTPSSTSSKFCFDVVNLTEYYLENSFNEKKSKLLKTSQVFDTDESVDKFVNETVPKTIARKWMKYGMLIPEKPRVNFEYFLNYPSKGCHKFSNQILKNLGRSASLLLKDILTQEVPNLLPSETIRLEAILECFNDYGNWDFHYYLGMSKMTRNDHQGAKEPLERALRCIENDVNVDQNTWSSTKEHIRANLLIIREVTSAKC